MGFVAIKSLRNKHEAGSHDLRWAVTQLVKKFPTFYVDPNRLGKGKNVNLSLCFH
jgi:hypothetical protein